MIGVGSGPSRPQRTISTWPTGLGSGALGLQRCVVVGIASRGGVILVRP
jgi:hypothetical protein